MVWEVLLNCTQMFRLEWLAISWFPAHLKLIDRLLSVLTRKAAAWNEGRNQRVKVTIVYRGGSHSLNYKARCFWLPQSTPLRMAHWRCNRVIAAHVLERKSHDHDNVGCKPRRRASSSGSSLIVFIDISVATLRRLALGRENLHLYVYTMDWLDD